MDETNTDNNKLDNKLDVILEKLNNLESKYKSLENKLDNIQKSTQNMDDHIDFVETVYNVIKNPVSSLLRLYYKSYINDQIEDFAQIKRIKNDQN